MQTNFFAIDYAIAKATKLWRNRADSQIRHILQVCKDHKTIAKQHKLPNPPELAHHEHLHIYGGFLENARNGIDLSFS